jgi:hypothetical protein
VTAWQSKDADLQDSILFSPHSVLSPASCNIAARMRQQVGGGFFYRLFCANQVILYFPALSLIGLEASESRNLSLRAGKWLTGGGLPSLLALRLWQMM